MTTGGTFSTGTLLILVLLSIKLRSVPAHMSGVLKKRLPL